MRRPLASCLRSYRAPPALRSAARTAWTRRWWCQLSVAVQQAVTSTALGQAGPCRWDMPRTVLPHKNLVTAEIGPKNDSGMRVPPEGVGTADPCWCQATTFVL